MRSRVLAFVLLAACGGGRSAPDGGGGDDDPDGATDPDASGFDAMPAPRVSVIASTHRYVPGAMFGGWGPHLGHLVRLPSGQLFWVDDACTQGVDCSVDVDRRLEYRELVGDTWELRASLPLPAGIQQNTGTIVEGGTLASFGVDTATRRLVRCAMSPVTWTGGCAAIVDADLPLSTNYVGAAISPEGYPVTWATTVVDGGGGSFHWWADYGGGWNGPRTGGIGGYNDASYIHLAFGADAGFVMHAQLVAGLAPSWTFRAAVGDGDAATVNAVTFATLAPELISTCDVLVEPDTGDTHVLARTTAGDVKYLYRPSGGAYAAAVDVPGAYYRARWVLLDDGRVVMAHAKNGAGLAYRVFPARTAGALDVAAAAEIPVALPDGYTSVLAIYPEAAVYQRTAPSVLGLAVVGTERQNEVVHVEISL
jgi:hypothetical protein